MRGSERRTGPRCRGSASRYAMSRSAGPHRFPVRHTCEGAEEQGGTYVLNRRTRWPSARGASGSWQEPGAAVSGAKSLWYRSGTYFLGW